MRRSRSSALYTLRPNPSLEPTRYRRQRKPGLRSSVPSLRPALRCLVYPRPGEFPLPPALPAAASGERQGDAGQEDFAGFRPHQPADSPRHVAWKAVARDPAGGPLLVKQFAGGAASELWLDRDLLPAGIDPESGLSILTGWVLAAEAAGLAYGLRLAGSELAPASGEGHRRRCLEALALAAAP